jgi:hypothetical protein
MIKAAAGIAIGIGVGVALSNVALSVGLAIVFGAAFSRIDIDGKDND